MGRQKENTKAAGTRALHVESAMQRTRIQVVKYSPCDSDIVANSVLFGL